MALKNYTSQVAASRSIGYIEHRLAVSGANKIMKQYDDKQRVSSIVFSIMINDNDVPFKLPSRIEECEAVLKAEVKRPRPETMKRIEGQAERTAWKIVSDWVDAQMAMIELAQVELLEVFLPYAYNELKEQTFYESVKERGFKALLGTGGK